MKRVTRERRTGARGRHTIGRPAAVVHPGEWDLDKKVVADQLNQIEPGWLVFYEPYSRGYRAIPYVQGLDQPVTAPDADSLQVEMRHAESFPWLKVSE